MIALIAIWVLGLMVYACKCVGYIFLAYFLFCLGSYCCNLFRYLVARTDNGYCYLIAFGRWRFLGAALCGAYPDVWHCANICSWVVGVDFFDDFKVTYNDGVLHLEPRAEGDPEFDHDWDCPLDFGQFLSSSLPLGAKAGAAVASELHSTASDARLVAEKIPIANDVKRSASKWVSAVRSEVKLPRLPRMPSAPHPKRRIAGDDEVREPFVVRRRLNAASAMEASKVLLSGMDVLGPSEERIPSALEAFPDGIATSVPPSAPQFERLTHMLGPLRYTPRTEGHAAAATLRRAALAHASAALQGAIVGLVSPSTAELHAFPMAVVWQYEDSLDASRNRKHCTLCRAPTCSVLQQAKGAGRHFRGQDWTRAAALFKRFEVSSLILTNIEPNMHARDLTQLMVSSGAYHAYSLVSVDWRVILGRAVEDRLIGMTTEQSFGKVVSSFSDGGDYVQSLGNVRALFAPTYAAGHALRRTIIFGEGASQFFELNLSRGGWATRCVPQHSKYYFIRLVMPNTARPIVLVEKAGFDRVLATFRTQAIKSKDTARITLRQSVVTYSISGTQVTPRLAVTGTEAEALAVWIEVYSEVQDAMAEAQSEAMKPRTATESVKSTVFNMVTDKLAKSSAGAMALGSYSALQALINVYRTEIGEQTLEQMSDAAMVEHFGTKVQPESLQNSIVSKWGQVCAWARSPSRWVKLLNDKMRDSWATSFGYVDALAITALLSSVVSLRVMRVACDCLVVVCRIAGRTDVMNKVVNFIEHLDWQVAKASKFWVTIQSAQDLDFQAATIDIVETFFNVFGRDVAAEVQAVRESGMLTEEEVEELALTAALPYSDFLSEVKLFLGKFNSSVRRATLAASMLTTFRLDCRKVAPGQKEKMIHLLKQEMEAAKSPAMVEAMAFALGGEPRSEPLPIRPIRGRSVRDAFKDGHLDMTCSEGKFTLHRLHQQGGVFDFSPIHTLMDLQHGDAINPANLKGPSYLSPDERGARLQEALIKHVVDHAMGARFVAPAAMAPWYTAQLEADGQIPYVSEILARQESLFTGAQAKNWRAHVTGLAMGGKSKGLRSWISSLDVVVVPTRQLKEEWQENLGKLDPVRRATVVTQHEALDVKYAARYVFIDECYAFDPEHLQAIANRHVKSKGVITIGDKRQIGNVFSVTGNRLQTAECPCVMITPTTFVGWDAAAVYLSTTTTDTFVEHLYCGSDNPESLRYALSSDDTLLPGQGDRAIQGTQIAKEMMLQRGVTCNTVHECQGSRTQNTVVHGLGRALMGDLSWLASPDQYAHCGVLITRARETTVFVVDGLEAMRPFRWFDAQVVNGALPTTLIYAGTSWDLVEPRTESESTWEHLHEPSITETHLEEVPLTDPVTIGTVFNSDGEALSSSEIRTNVELVAGVTLRDDGVAHSDEFDNYTIQPRDVPGADMVQALTRAIPDIRPTPRDFEDAEVIVQWIFEEVIDKKTFFAHVANSRRAALTRQTRQQVIDGCYASTETAASTLSFGFLKPEFAKKPSELRDGPSELKAQGVVSASDMQQAIFADACDALTHAWARSMKRGKLSPVGYREEEVEDFLSTFTSSYELDIEKQDSSHRPVHVIVASIMLELASDKLGLGQLAREIREERRVRMMGTPFKFVLNTALASGDPWTLIINKIMAVSSLISVAKLADVRMCQSGDDVTLDREPEWRCVGLRSQSMANRGLTWKLEEREQRRQGVTFISRAVLPNRTVVYKALRTILKYMSRPRNSIQHAGIQADALRVQRLAARHGLQAYAEARAQVWGGDPVVIFDMWTRALAVARAPFNSLPPELVKDEPRQYSIKERNGGCFGYALAQCVSSNVAAINAIAMYPTAVTITTALEACRDNKVGCLVMNETFANRSRRRLQEAMDRRHFTRAFVVVYEDHAVAVVPNTLTIHSGFGKRTISWKSSTSKDIEITDFE